MSNFFTSEAISIQSDLKFIDNISDYLDDIRAVVDYKHIRNGLKIYTDNDIYKYMKLIDKELEQRFKIPVKHIYSATIYATIPLKPNADNALVADVDQIIGQLSDVGRICTDDPTCDENIEPFTVDTIADASRVCNNTIKNSKDLLKQITKGKIVIDRKNATIKGVKLSKPIYILSDTLALFKNYNLTNREIIAILLHEVGHIYTHIEYMYTRTNTDIANAEKILESLTTKQPSDKKLLLESIDNVYGKAIDKINSDNRLYITNSEELADLFASRFGLAPELVTGLEKIKSIYVKMSNMALIGTLSVLMTYVSILTLIIGTEAILMAYTATIVFLAISTISGIIFSSSDGNGTTYDSDRDRYRRLKNNLISTIRSKNYKENELEYLITTIDYMIHTINALEDKSFIENVSDKMPWNISTVQYHMKSRILEDLLDNELHYKIKKLKG